MHVIVMIAAFIGFVWLMIVINVPSMRGVALLVLGIGTILVSFIVLNIYSP